MPGLVGIISLDWRMRVDFSQHKKMVQAIFHRKWYKQMDVISEKGNYAISRIHHGILNYIEEPISDPDASASVIIEGEIYNDIPPGISESEYILELYLRKGENFPENLNGSFVVIIIDKKNGKILISNDRTASRPLFYYNDGKFLYFSPEMKAFLTIPVFHKKVNEAAIASFLSSGYLINRLTYFENVNRLDNASLLVIEDDQVKKKKYWDYMFIEDQSDWGIDYYVREFGELLQNAVTRKLKGEFAFGILLSGGIDSRLILGPYQKIEPDCLPNTITFGIRENIPESDGVRAKELSRIINSNHSFFDLIPNKIIDHIDDIIYLNEGLTDTAGNYPECLNIFKSIREKLGVDILLRGDHCYCWGGRFVYNYEDILPAQSIFSFSLIPQLQHIIRDDKHRDLNETHNCNLKEALARSKSANLHNRKDFFHLDQRLISYANPLSYLKRIEIETRNPLIDNELLDLNAKIPYQHRIDKKLFYESLRKDFPKLSVVPIALRNNDINWENAIKQDSILQEFFRSILIDKNNSFDEYINKKELSIFLEEYFSRDVANDRYNSWIFGQKIILEMKRFKPLVQLVRKLRQPWRTGSDSVIFRLLTLKVWFDLFVDRSPKTF